MCVCVLEGINTCVCVCEGETEVLHGLATNNSPNCTLLRSPAVTSWYIKCITHNLAYV